MHTTQGTLRDNSPLRKIFSDGTVPLVSPLEEIAALGEVKKVEPVFLSNPQKWTPEQRERAAAFMSELGQGSVALALEHLRTATQFPIRAYHFSSVSADLRLFL